MKAMTVFAAATVPGATVQTMAKASWQKPQAATPQSTMVRRSIQRTMNKLARTPIRPMHVTMTEYENAFVTPATVRKYVV